MGALVILFWIIIGLICLIALMGLIGFIITKRRAAKGEKDPSGQPAEVLPERTVNNVFDLRDRFNRARYMNRDDNEN